MEDAAEGVGRLPEETGRQISRRTDRIVTSTRRNAPSRTGALRGSYQAEMRRRPDGLLDVVVSSTDPAAATQEEGGKVTGRNMPVPIGEARGINPRSVVGLFMLTARDGRRYLAAHEGQSLRLWYALLDEVTVPATRPLGRAVDEHADDIADEAVDETARRVLP
jgi:hypothetical protein